MPEPGTGALGWRVGLRFGLLAAAVGLIQAAGGPAEPLAAQEQGVYDKSPTTPQHPPTLSATTQDSLLCPKPLPSGGNCSTSTEISPAPNDPGNTDVSFSTSGCGPSATSSTTKVSSRSSSKLQITNSFGPDYCIALLCGATWGNLQDCDCLSVTEVP